MKKISNKICYVEIPENWESELREGMMTIYNPDGKGAIIISSYTVLAEPQSIEEALAKFVKGKGVINVNKNNGLDIAVSEYEDITADGSYYIFALAAQKSNNLVLTSYNVAKKYFDDNELNIAKKIISSLRIT